MTPLEIWMAVEANVKERLEEGDGHWRSCSGCYETEDGQNIHGYQHSKVFGCELGGGCRECGGIGAVWDTTDYGAMADEIQAGMDDVAANVMGTCTCGGDRNQPASHHDISCPTALADVPQTGRDAIIEECAKICDDVAARAYRLMEDPKAARKVLAAVANGSMECAENIRSSSVTRPDQTLPHLSGPER